VAFAQRPPRKRFFQRLVDKPAEKPRARAQPANQPGYGMWDIVRTKLRFQKDLSAEKDGDEEID